MITENPLLSDSWTRSERASWIHSERAGLDASSRAAGVRFSAAVERSWGAGLQPLFRIASPTEHEIWSRLVPPAAVNTLVRNGCPVEAIETMLRIGALEYA